MSQNNFFVTGVGTDIGKTFVTAGLARRAIDAGIKTALVKPVQTGTDDYPPDVVTIARLVDGLYPLPREIAIPFEFKFAASPHLAAQREGRALITADIVAACRRAEQTPGPELLLFEGAGGLI
ncbi:MAG: dethiobiotin synthase, partial [Victivallales bacterium]|nr:dethiobiotin synthase [Victivallales bacterium]